MAFINDNTGKSVTHDPERSISMHEIPAGPDPIFPFVLKWHDKDIKFAGENEINRYQNDEGKWRFNYDWTIISLTIPEDFPENLENIKQVISEALTCFGEGYDNSRVNEVKVAFEERAEKAQGFY